MGAGKRELKTRAVSACGSLVAAGLSEPDADLRAGIWGLGALGGHLGHWS